MYDRRNPYLRQQYNTLKNCYFNCKGEVDGCKNYMGIDNQTCVAYVTLLNDEKKLKEGNKYLTYPLLEVILENEIHKRK